MSNTGQVVVEMDEKSDHELTDEREILLASRNMAETDGTNLAVAITEEYARISELNKLLDANPSNIREYVLNRYKDIKKDSKFFVCGD